MGAHGKAALAQPLHCQMKIPAQQPLTRRLLQHAHSSRPDLRLPKPVLKRRYNDWLSPAAKMPLRGQGRHRTWSWDSIAAAHLLNLAAASHRNTARNVKHVRVIIVLQELTAFWAHLWERQRLWSCPQMQRGAG